eukprot:Blabericola_migrator_1__3402@NODE_1_length_33786_cov_123_788665_g0_i0_p22_GENE_NODE_1_length_33786_cov_123_788665_g0_i0NODE_1_length_33786_cov_123_788665_g0_i0_p22_ORF_typecomplete_len201_score27_60TPT/PF03151_16/1_9e19UAA/PF08449_11/0_017_NODE_1_length_33786_cov_123_788665_g0_i01284013442
MLTPFSNDAGVDDNAPVALTEKGAGTKLFSPSKRRAVLTATHKTAYSIKTRFNRSNGVGERWNLTTCGLASAIAPQQLAEGLRVLSMLVAWYTASLVLTACNKVLLDSLSFPYPLIVTTIHFAGVALIIRTMLITTGTNPLAALDYITYTRQILPIALFTAIEIALSNQAYSMVSLSVMTVIKSTLVAATYITSIIAGKR